MLRIAHAAWFGLMGLAGGYLMNVTFLTQGVSVFSEPLALAMVAATGLIGVVGSILYYDEL
jgi:hypothetical protein